MLGFNPNNNFHPVFSWSIAGRKRREDTNRVCQNTRRIFEVKKKIIFYVCWNDCAGVALRNSRKGLYNINPVEFEILDMCRFRILTRIIARHTPLKSNNKWYLKCAVFFGKQDTSFYPKTSDTVTHFLSLEACFSPVFLHASILTCRIWLPHRDLACPPLLNRAEEQNGKCMSELLVKSHKDSCCQRQRARL